MNKIRVHRRSVLLSDIPDLVGGLRRATVRTINPDQTGLITHSEVTGDELGLFWQGTEAAEQIANAVGYEAIHRLGRSLILPFTPEGLASGPEGVDLSVFWLGVNAVVRTWVPKGFEAEH
ncbi:MAG TPA: hypothetical protein VFH99_01120 [Candidatus Saccharimonadales bacterium]|nr:hypothetical protein [Candidatus Saccharimonadales bacterium]